MNERRLILAVLLLTSAERDEELVRYESKKRRSLISQEAREWIDGDECKRLCRLIEVDYVAVRDMRPQDAMKGFKKLMSNEGEDGEI